MSVRRWLLVLALFAAGGAVACSDATAPIPPLQKKASLAKPTGATFGRYILISGVVTCVEDCDDGGSGQKADGGSLTGSDSLPGVELLPSDTSSPPASSGGN